MNIAENEFNMIRVHVYNEGISNLDDLINNIVEEILSQIKLKSWSKRIFDLFRRSIEEVGFLGTNIKFKPHNDNITLNIKENFSHFLIELVKSSKK